ncbi:GNAT family N-acetyltransferase [Staphylococcus hyicus]|uniref:GNAT family N-acetyltransferase n=2 Tax=Staphylococcus hyicus TaxID=1284 RepID=A0ACD5FJM4_STAHY|nr:GNAT family protein [Staphylococcus hyicus]AJC96874.1 acetyltransferase [Staphylococcus hyicus]MCE5153645.1 GNAT family N-acetyltransferase [Staphylococcus hyicus]MDP4449617.1 GNAT family protein [Staphylococcus hyicus]MDP4462019.1 GNAT family protein [Staphylococcus hyicus]MDP4464076.1 GNAT family protein [Staphylococcus hyicus]
MHYFRLPIDTRFSLVKLDMSRAYEVFEVVKQEREHLREFLDWIDYVQSIEDEVKFLKEALRLEAENQSRLYFIYEENQLVGAVDLHKIDTINNQGEVGYWLSQHVTGQGVMTKAVKLLCDIAFNELMLNRLEIRAQKENIASQRVAEKAGFRFMGEARESLYRNNTYVTMYHYELLKRHFSNT